MSTCQHRDVKILCEALFGSCTDQDDLVLEDADQGVSRVGKECQGRLACKPIGGIHQLVAE